MALDVAMFTVGMVQENCFLVRPEGGEPALFSGDVLFQGSVGRIDLPGGDGPTLMRSIAMLLERFDDETVVHPGHMGITTLGRERTTNPFLKQPANW
jgi:glyoxylase-like metal-dependent hydrolase (beta-lactamase superfamily II)